MSETDNYKSSLSDEANFRRMKGQEGSGKPRNDSVYSIEQIEAKGGLITNVDRLGGIGESQKEEEKRKAGETAMAVAQAEMNYQQNSKYISSRLEDGTLFSGSFENFSKDLAIAIQTSQHYYKRVELGLNTPEEDTRHDCMCVQLYLEASKPGNSEKLEQVMSNPDSAKIYVRGQQIFLQMRDQGEFVGMSPEQIENARHKIFENVEKNRHTLDKIETPSDLASLKELQTYLDYRVKNPDIVPKDFKDMNEQQRGGFWEENGARILNEYKQSNPDADLAKLKSALPDSVAAGKSYNPKTGEFNVSIFDEVSQRITEKFTKIFSNDKNDAELSPEEANIKSQVSEAAAEAAEGFTTGGVAGFVDGAIKSDAGKAFLNNLNPEAKAAVEDVKAKDHCGCSHVKPKAEQAPKPEHALTQIQPADTPAQSATQAGTPNSSSTPHIG